jgi:threonine dehydrogenase-like Zn-dependent dehydrogenase
MRHQRPGTIGGRAGRHHPHFSEPPIGCLHADLAKVRGAAGMIMVHVQEHRLEMAKAFAVEAVIDGAREDVLARVLQETGPRELR